MATARLRVFAASYIPSASKKTSRQKRQRSRHIRQKPYRTRSDLLQKLSPRKPYTARLRTALHWQNNTSFPPFPLLPYLGILLRRHPDKSPTGLPTSESTSTPSTFFPEEGCSCAHVMLLLIAEQLHKGVNAPDRTISAQAVFLFT